MIMTNRSEAKPVFELDRRIALPALLGKHEDFLIVAGLAGTAFDIAVIAGRYAPHTFPLGGAMGAAVPIGLGLALARPDKRVLVATGDGELLMNVSSLATVGVINPPNLSILCVDNGHYGETGYQKSHTSRGVDLERMAIGAGIKSTCVVERQSDIAAGARMLRESNGSCFVLLRVSNQDSDKTKLSFDAPAMRIRFRQALLGHP
jgi:thiamine pyrophosphate-dependent acetolactate synthase large subunit-like protein